VDLRRKADSLLTFMLQTDWSKLAMRCFLARRRRFQRSGLWVIGNLAHVRHMRRRDWQLLVRDLCRLVRQTDIRKPTHAVAVGLILAGIMVPVLSWMADNERYRLDGPEASVVTRPAPHLKDKLQYIQKDQQNVFNAGGQQILDQQSPDVMTARVGGAEKKTTQLYTATFPNNPSSGIVVNDNVNKVPVTFKPQFGLMSGRDEDGHVVYPLTGQDGQVVYTPKANAMKEDIVLNSASADTIVYKYELDMPKYMKAMVDADGSVGFYTADPILFGNIQFGSQKDQESTEKARENSAKTYEMFKVPAPVIVQSGVPKGNATGRFWLQGNVLSLTATNLKSASYPLSIDPTFYLTSTADFLLGSSDDNVDLSVANQVGRAALGGGQLDQWTRDQCAGTNKNLLASNFAFGITAYNGYIYELGGGNTASTTVDYADINLTSGVVGCTTTWTALTGFTTARVAPQAFGYNGYIYVVGGENSAGTTIYGTTFGSEYAQLTSTGTLAANSGCGQTWCTGTNLNTSRAWFASALYQGVIYVFGGSTSDSPTMDGTLTNTVEYSRINGDGSLGTWHTTTNMLSARDRFSAAAYNGYVYAVGGQTNSTTVTNVVQYAPINSDGTLGSWANTTSFPTARRDFGFAMERGHMYIYGGCTSGNPCGTFPSDSEYGVINADGTIGQWQQTANTAASRGTTDEMATTFYNGHLYTAGGCSNERSGNNNCQTRSSFVGYATPDTTGTFDGLSAQANSPFNPQASSSARYGGQAVALNGWVYYIGGSASTTGATYSSLVSAAQINTDGSLAAWTTTGMTALPAQAGDSAGRIGFTAAAWNNKIYVIGGVELTTPGVARNYLTSVISSTQASNGTLGAWGNETALPAVTAFHTTVIWNNFIYAIAGRDSTATVKNKVYYATIGTTGTLGSWSTSTNNIGTAVWGQAGAIYGNYVYLASGNTSTTADSRITTVQRGTVQSSGDISGWTTVTAIGTAVQYARALMHNDFLYVMGGSVNGTTQVLVQYAQIVPSTGALATNSGCGATWCTTNVGANTFSGTDGLGFARGAEAGVDVDGYMYLMGGCHTTESTFTFDNCTTIVTATTTTETEVYQPNDGGTGQTGAWSTTGATALTTAKADAAALAYNGYLYSVGGCTGYTTGACTGSGQYSSDVRYASINSDGTLGSWSAATAQLATGTMLLQIAAYNGYMYVLGGRTNATGAVSTVLYGTIGSTGDITTWNTGTAMDAGGVGSVRRNFGVAISNGYIYAAGGENASGTKLSSTEYAALSASDGSVGSWTNGTSLATTNQSTTARSGTGLVAYAGNLYIVGGVDSGGNTLQDIQYAPLNSGTGAIGSWANTIEAPRGSISRQTYAANGYMYFLGNETTSTQVSYADISSNGTLGALHDQPNVLAGAHAHGSVAYYNGILYLLGGCTLSSGVCSTVSSTNEKAGQLAISRAAHYSKLWQTQGVDTAPSQISLGGTLQGQGSAVAAILRTASSFDSTLGVAQIINPVIFNTFYRVFALNSSGTNVGVANTYALQVKLDDTQEGTFPDINTSQTAVSDITLYYHANPGRRLRHGASFSNVGCNITPQNGCILDTAP
jgi:hypothetical protein